MSESLFRCIYFDILPLIFGDFLAFRYDKFQVPLSCFLTRTMDPFLHRTLLPFTGEQQLKQQATYDFLCFGHLVRLYKSYKVALVSKKSILNEIKIKH